MLFPVRKVEAFGIYTVLLGIVAKILLVSFVNIYAIVFSINRVLVNPVLFSENTRLAKIYIALIGVVLKIPAVDIVERFADILVGVRIVASATWLVVLFLLDSNLAQLEAANQINQSNYDANRQQLQDYYNQQRNAAAAEYERQRYNQNLQAQMNGLNVGTGSQMSLALNNQYQANQTALGKAQMQAQAEIDRAVANLNVQYQADVAAAIGQNDYQKAAALYQDKLDREKQMTQYYQMLISEMNTRASYGDFAMMRQIYGDDAANMALRVWAQQNPDAAYNQGNITAEEYKQITGKYPRGYKGTGSGGGYGGSANNQTVRYDSEGNAYLYTGQNFWTPIDDYGNKSGERKYGIGDTLTKTPPSSEGSK